MGRRVAMRFASAVVLAMTGQGATAAEAVDRTTLRVCADPASPPLSSEREGGVEMRIAELFGRKLGVPVTYVWFPSGIGFYRRTLNIRRCDLVIGAAVGLDVAATTIPYYRSSYVLVTRAGDGITLDRFDAPQAKAMVFGVQALTPGGDLLAQAGLLDRAKVYDLQVGAQAQPVAEVMLQDLGAKRIDGAVLWGPIGGYFAAQKPGAYRVTPLAGVAGGRPPVFDIAMAVRFGEPRWKAQIEKFIREDHAEIAAILEAAHVPLQPLVTTPATEARP